MASLWRPDPRAAHGLVSGAAGSSRLIVSGKVGVKEIERLIPKLEIDKEILADQEGDADEKAAN